MRLHLIYLENLPDDNRVELSLHFVNDEGKTASETLVIDDFKGISRTEAADAFQLLVNSLREMED